MKYIRVTLAILICFFLFAGCSSNSQHHNKENVSITISAAASLSDALVEIKEEFMKKHTEINVILNFGGSGSLQQQIKQGAPVDVYFSAAEKPFAELLDKNLIYQENQSVVIGNSLVLISPKDRTLDSLDSLLDEDINTVAIGTPESVPAGMYAKESMISKGIWDELKDKLVMAKDVRQVLTYVETGNVGAGFVYKTEAIDSNKVQIVMDIPSDLHDPIVYPAGVVRSTKNKEEAVLFYEYLKSPESIEIFNKYGFLTLE